MLTAGWGRTWQNHSIISHLNIFPKATPSFLQSPASILAGILENHIRDFNYERGEMKNRHSEKYQCLCVKFVGNFLTSLIKTKTLTYHMKLPSDGFRWQGQRLSLFHFLSFEYISDNDTKPAFWFKYFRNSEQHFFHGTVIDTLVVWVIFCGKSLKPCCGKIDHKFRIGTKGVFLSLGSE